ncbi:MAG: hypothetical protein PHR14_10550 [Oscillospiraceae bacterium]|nr:hypothetical protein [Oscillospiraceae bacterium]
MVSKLLGALVTIVVGLALLPIVSDFVDGLTGTGMVYENTTTGSLIDLLPILYVLILVGGTIVAVAFSSRKKE